MSKQRPNPDKIANELAGASSFFKPVPTKPMEDPAPVPPALNPPSTPQPGVPHVAPQLEADRPSRTPRTPGRPVKRQMIRHPFEFYMDQLEALRELAETQRRNGEPGSMSRMVRQVIDRYLDEQPRDGG